MKMPKASEETEHHVKQQVRKILKETGWTFWMPGAGAYGRGGVSDFLAVKKPRMFMAIETKYKDVPDARQLKFLAGIDAAGHYAFLVDETNIETFRAALTRNDSNTVINITTLFKWKEMGQ